MTISDMWTYREQRLAALNITGFSVEAIDGGIGKVDESNDVVGSSYVIVDTGPWIFGKKVMLPAGVVDRVDLDTETIYVSRTKEQIKNAPEFDEERWSDTGVYRAELGAYYGPGGPGYPAGS